MDIIDVPIIACNDGLVHREKEQTTPVRPCTRRPSTPCSNWKPGISGRKSRDADKSSRGSRIRSASAGRDSKSELTSRYWSYLFGNLERSISEIYDSCEKQDNVLQCKEVLLLLENYVRDFNNLIEWLNLKWSYEQTPPPMRPNALAWEIRKPSLCILPHTRAYEKLVGIVSSPHKAPDFYQIEGNSASKPASLNNALSFLSNSNTQSETTQSSAIDYSIKPVLSDTNNETECTTDNRVDVGLQTEFDDPDIYYFAGGRNIACQTDFCDQYGPLIPLPCDTTPVIIVLDPCDSDTEMSIVMDSSANELNMCDSLFRGNKLTPMTDPSFSEVNLCKSEPCAADNCVAINNPTNIDTGVCTVVETKSSATQLSVGVLVEEPLSTPVHDGSGDNCTKHVELQSETVNVITEKKPAENPNKFAVVKHTFADKAKNGMMRPNTLQTKSVPNNINKLGAPTPTSGKGSSPNQKGKIVPSYRSNIASRCRAALNTSKQQVLSPVKYKLSTSFSASAGLSYLTSAAVKYNNVSRDCDQANSKGFWNSKSSGQIKPSISLRLNSTKRTIISNNNSTKTLAPEKADIGDKKKYSIGKTNLARQGSTAARNPDARNENESRAGIARSKSMITSTLSPSTRRVGPNSLIESRRSAGNKQSEKAIIQNQRNIGRNSESKNKSFVSLPDVSVHRKRNSTVDEDGWETVRARSSRSKWSPSGSSVSIPLMAENISANDNHTNNNWKDVDDDAAGEDEEIKKKEEDLDNAIREEELIEEELRQVEKDFEMIENESRDDATTSENDNAPSPDGMHPFVELDVEKEQFFFICMDDEAGAKAEDFPPREPGRIVTLREKLMSPAKKCDSAETLRKYQAKLEKAERNREKLLQAKFNRYVELSERFEALNETTKKLVTEREELIAKAEARLQRAAKNRKLHLQNIVKKAHDEEAKAKEIAFINLLEAQNKRHDYLAIAHEIEGRLQTIQEDRRLKLEERATKSLSVIERQTRIRNNWQSKLDKMQEKRRKADERITREKEEKAKERSELAQEKAREREERKSALEAAHRAKNQKLQISIQKKQEDTARRHEEKIEHIRQKAIELSVPRISEDSSIQAIVRVCTLCKVSLPSEVQELTHLRGRSHMDAVRKAENLPISIVSLESFGLKYVCDVQSDKIDFKLQVDKNRLKTLKKHCKKVMQKLMDSGNEYEEMDKQTHQLTLKTANCDLDLKAKIHKNIRELDRLNNLFINNKGNLNNTTTMERTMGEIKKVVVNVRAIRSIIVPLDGINVAMRIIKSTASDLPEKIKISACAMLVGMVYDCLPNVVHCIRGTTLSALAELCSERLSTLIPDGNRWVVGSLVSTTQEIPYDPLLESMLEVLFNILNTVPDPFHGIEAGGAFDKFIIQDVKSRVFDLIGYLVSSSVIDRFSIYCSAICGPIDKYPQVADFLKFILDFLVMIVYALQYCWPVNPVTGKKESETTQLLAALESSELAGAVSMSYTLLLHQGAPLRPRVTPGITETEIQSKPPPPGYRTASIVRSTLLLINAVARVDHQALQNVLGSEAVSLQFRHIASQLLWQVVPYQDKPDIRKLFNELIIGIGYFTVGNRHNQITIQSGQTPTVMQQLCTLPHEWKKDSTYQKVIYPTLVSAAYGCPENQEILLQNNIDLRLLDLYIRSDHAAQNDLLKKLKLSSSAKVSGSMFPLQNGNIEGFLKQNGNIEIHNNLINNIHALDSRS